MNNLEKLIAESVKPFNIVKLLCPLPFSLLPGQGQNTSKGTHKWVKFFHDPLALLLVVTPLNTWSKKLKSINSNNNHEVIFV